MYNNKLLIMLQDVMSKCEFKVQMMMDRPYIIYYLEHSSKHGTNLVLQAWFYNGMHLVLHHHLLFIICLSFGMFLMVVGMSCTIANFICTNVEQKKHHDVDQKKHHRM